MGGWGEEPRNQRDNKAVSLHFPEINGSDNLLLQEKGNIFQKTYCKE